MTSESVAPLQKTLFLQANQERCFSRYAPQHDKGKWVTSFSVLYPQGCGFGRQTSRIAGQSPPSPLSSPCMAWIISYIRCYISLVRRKEAINA